MEDRVPACCFVVVVVVVCFFLLDSVHIRLAVGSAIGSDVQLVTGSTGQLSGQRVKLSSLIFLT